MKIQSILFNKKYYTIDKIYWYLQLFNFKINLTEDEEFYIWRQKNIIKHKIYKNRKIHHGLEFIYQDIIILYINTY